ncbi:MAG TPA: hypothetical protein DCE81_06365, partial [Cytophagales bacterium]|nr:hypothetical protein [Cytophagales bacterium]
NASYSVLNYTNSLEYTDVDVNNPVENYNRSQFANQVNSKGELIPVYVINQFLIAEQFQQLIGVNVRTKSRMNLRFEYKTKR